MPGDLTETSFSAIVSLCRSLESTSKRNDKRRLLASFLRNLRPDEIAPAVRLTIGRIFSEDDIRTLDVGFRTLFESESKIGQSTLVASPPTIRRIEAYLADIARAKGEGSRKRKEGLLAALLSGTSSTERSYLARSLMGEMRHGVVEGMMTLAIADAFSLHPELVNQAYAFTGDLGKVATIACLEGAKGLQRIDIELLSPIRPMLAEASANVEDALSEHGGTSMLEYKFDGARIQAHKDHQQVVIFSRRLTDVTRSLPEIADMIARQIRATTAILEGEVVAVDNVGRPLPFQDLMRRYRRVHNITESARAVPLRLYLFDILHSDGRTLLSRPYAARRRALGIACDENLLAKTEIVSDKARATEILRDAVEAGHEGVMMKAPEGTYKPGRRTSDWLKVKPAVTLDLVIVAADWGYGRRSRWLSNYHLAAFNSSTGQYEVIGKTFKGLTDAEFEWMTSKLRSLAVSQNQYTVNVEPKMVVEVTFNEVQSSPTYKSGYALRFARITKIREDKSAEEADTIDRVAALFDSQYTRKGRIQTSQQ